MSPSVLVMAVLAAAMLGLCFRRSPATARRALAETGYSLRKVAPIVLIALPMAAFLSELIPDGWARDWLGPESGLQGIAIAALAGGFLPGGPFVAFPLVLGFLKAGAGPAQMVALISGWAILGLHRTLTWELPVLGARFVALRLTACCLLPLLAGLLAAWMLPWFPEAALR